MAKNKGIFSRFYILILLATLLMISVFNMLTTVLPVYLLKLTGSSFYSGMVTASYTAASLAARLLLGACIDKYKRKRILLSGLILTLLSCAGMCFTKNIAGILFLRAVQGIGFSLVNTATATMVADVTDKRYIADAVGFFLVCNSVAQAVGPTLGLSSLNSFGILSALVLGMLALAAACFIAMFINYEKGLNIRVKRTEQRKEKLDCRIYVLAAGMLLVTFAQGAIMSFLAIHGESKGIENVSIYFTVNAVCLIAVRLFMGRITERFSEKSLVAGGQILMICGLLCIALAQNTAWVVAASVFYGIGYGIVQPTISVQMLKLGKSGQNGTINVVFYASMDLGYAISSVLWGIISENIGTAAVFYGAMCIVTLAIGVSLCGSKTNHKNCTAC